MRSRPSSASTSSAPITGTASRRSGPTPERALEDKRFWEVFDQCSKQPSPHIARAFFLRELMGLETDEICKELSISAANCRVML
jgi:DNA-directed RNA polymerase specialized sigma24 family protein